MHWRVPRTRGTACGRDVRGLRSTKQASLVTCKLCVAAAVLRATETRTGRRVGIGGFVGLPPSPFLDPARGPK